MKFILTFVTLIIFVATSYTQNTVTGYGSVSITGTVVAEVVEPAQLKSTAVTYENDIPVFKQTTENGSQSLQTVSILTPTFIRIDDIIINNNVWKAIELKKNSTSFVNPVTRKDTYLKNVSEQPILTHKSKAGIDNRFCFITINYN